MRYIIFTISLGFSPLLQAQEPTITPTEELKITISEWVETMRQIQEEENEWTRDQEVLVNYREGLEKEIESLKVSIADATTKKAGADADSLKQTQERDRYAAAKAELSTAVRALEEKMVKKLPLIPAPLRAEAKVSQAIDDLQRDIALPEDQRDTGVSKRLLNLINLAGEIEKFQQTVVLRQELRSDSDGREYNMKVLYFGLAVAYAVNDDGTLALIGQPSEQGGWKFEERSDLAGEISGLIASTTGDADAAFTKLPLLQP